MPRAAPDGIGAHRQRVVEDTARWRARRSLPHGSEIGGTPGEETPDPGGLVARRRCVAEGRKPSARIEQAGKPGEPRLDPRGDVGAGRLPVEGFGQGPAEGEQIEPPLKHGVREMPVRREERPKVSPRRREARAVQNGASGRRGRERAMT